MSRTEQENTENILWICVGCMLLFAVLVYCAHRYKDVINDCYTQFKIIETCMFAAIPGQIGEGWEKGVRSLLAQNMETVSFMKITAFFGKYQRFLWTPIFLFLAFKAYNFRTFYRTYTPQTLLEKGAEMFPAVAPFVHRDILKEPWNTGPWRLADSPLIFLIRNRLIFDENGYPFLMSQCFMCRESRQIYTTQLQSVDDALAGPLAPTEEELALILSWRQNPDGKMKKNVLSPAPLQSVYVETDNYASYDSAALIPIENSIYLYRNNKIDEPRLRRILKMQVGEKIDHADPFGSLKRQGQPSKLWLYGVAVALYAHGHSDETKKKDAVRLFDAINTSFAGKEEWEKVKINISNADDVLRDHPWKEDRVFVEQVLEKHGYYTNTFMMALLAFARKRGVVPCANFAWMRFYDRTTWYSLSQLGGRAAFVEAVGVWSHYHAEECALNPVALDPYVDVALEGIKTEMKLEGWLPSGNDSSEIHEEEKL